MKIFYIEKVLSQIIKQFMGLFTGLQNTNFASMFMVQKYVTAVTHSGALTLPHQQWIQ